MFAPLKVTRYPYTQVLVVIDILSGSAAEVGEESLDFLEISISFVFDILIVRWLVLIQLLILSMSC